METLAGRLESVRSSIASAVDEAGRLQSEVTLIVVTKFHPASLVAELAGLGVTDVGESRDQEAAPKVAELAHLDLNWHFVGQLQSKKAKSVLSYSSTIHSLDRVSLLDAIAATGRHADAFIQLNLTNDPGRGGVVPEQLEAFAERVLASSAVRLLGVMAVAPLDAQPRAVFAGVRTLSERLRTLAPAARFISMGMSGDYQEAILEGATHLRIGTAITGNRPVHG